MLKRIISENTSVSIGVVIALLGGAAWLTTLHADVASLKAAKASDDSFHQSIDERLSRIEGMLKEDLKNND